MNAGRVPTAIEPVVVPPRRSLTPNQRLKLFELRKGLCGICGLRINAHLGEQWIDEHMIPREISADDSFDNRWPVHVDCAKEKTIKDQGDIAKSRRIRKKRLGIKKPSRMSGARNGNLKKKIDGTVVDRRTGEVINRRT